MNVVVTYDYGLTVWNVKTLLWNDVYKFSLFGP